MILNQPNFFARSATLDGAISDTDTQITLSGLSTRFTDAVTAGTAGYEGGTALGPFRVSDDDGFELIAITGHVSDTTFEVERGIQGTTADAWADGTAVRAVVTRRQVVEDSRLNMALHTRVTLGPLSALAWSSFDFPDQNADGLVIESGHVLDVVMGSAAISDKTLVVEKNSIVLVGTSKLRSMEVVHSASARDSGVVMHYIDNNNFISGGKTDTSSPQDTIEIAETFEGGKTSIQANSVDSGDSSALREVSLRYKAGLRAGDAPYYSVLTAAVGRGSFAYDLDTNLQSRFGFFHGDGFSAVLFHSFVAEVE